MKERNGSLDLLKCLCMLFVVIIHLQGHSGYLAALNKDTFVYYVQTIWHLLSRLQFQYLY